MRWRLDDEQEAYSESLKGWMGAAAPTDLVRKWVEEDGTDEFERRLVDEGFAGVGIAEELGGQGGSTVELTLTGELLGQHAAPSTSWLTAALALPALAAHADLAELVSAGEPIALAVRADRPVDAARSVHVDAGGRLSGDVPHVLGASRATRILVPVDTPDGVEVRLVDTSDAPGLERSATPLLDPTRSAATVKFDQTPSTRLDVDATTFLTESATLAALLAAADSLGAQQRMLDMAVEYSSERHQFGQPIGAFQAVKHAAATILVGIEASRSIVYYAAASVAAGHELRGMHVAAAKTQVTAAGVAAADSALTLHGAIGYTWEHDLHLFYKRARFDAVLGGSNKVWNERIAIGLNLSGLLV